MTKKELIEALQALDCSDDTEVWVDDDGIGSSPIAAVTLSGDTIYIENNL